MFVLYFKHKHMCYIVTIADYGSFVCQCFARNFVYFFVNMLGMGAMTIILWVDFFMGDDVPHIHVHVGLCATDGYAIHRCSDDIIFIHRFPCDNCT